MTRRRVSAVGRPRHNRVGRRDGAPSAHRRARGDARRELRHRASHAVTGPRTAVPGTLAKAAAAVVAVAAALGGYALYRPVSHRTPGHGEDAAVNARHDGNAPSTLLPGMPPPLSPRDIYAADRPDLLSPSVRGVTPRVWVPNTMSDTVTVIDPATLKVIATVPVGHEPQHVVPSWDMQTLWVNNDLGNSLTPINPRTGQFGAPVAVHDPYNLYFTPDGRYAVVMASNDQQIVFRDAHTMQVVKAVPVTCQGVNHADFSADGRYFVVSCEFSGELLKLDTATMQVTGQLTLPQPRSKPQDVKLSPDGRTFYIADMQNGGVWTLDGDAFRVTGFVPTGDGAHGLYVSRDSRYLYVTNRGEGSVSLIDFATNQPATKWWIPGGGSPDMGGLSADGRQLWLTGRYNAEVYVIDTVDGHLIARIPVGQGPHGLCIFPQPGRYSLGHTGVYR